MSTLRRRRQPSGGRRRQRIFHQSSLEFPRGKRSQNHQQNSWFKNSVVDNNFYENSEDNKSAARTSNNKNNNNSLNITVENAVPQPLIVNNRFEVVGEEEFVDHPQNLHQGVEDQRRKFRRGKRNEN